MQELIEHHTHGVRLTCAKNKGERGCVGGGGRVELGDGRAVGDVRRSLSEE